MSELNFTIPVAEPDPVAVATLEFFKSAGKVENVAAGNIIFVEYEKEKRLFLKRNKMYLLLEGEVDLTVKKKPVCTILKGEIFGELAPITQAARSATATAKTACSLIALGERPFHAALQKNPEFALTLLNIMAGRLRKMIARLSEGSILFVGEELKKSVVFDKKLLAYLVRKLGDGARKHYGQGKIIMQEGLGGILMYVVLEGRVAVTIQDNAVEKIGPGGMFGELALIERTERLASAVAKTDCSLLAISRNVFLDLVKDNPEFGVALLGAAGERVRFMASRYAP